MYMIRYRAPYVRTSRSASLSAASSSIYLFFFQAEDGIRATSVTGVQTCALPICSEALVRDCLARIDAREATVRAWAFLDPELALRQARERDRTPARGALHGVPIGVRSEERRVGKSGDGGRGSGIAEKTQGGVRDD